MLGGGTGGTVISNAFLWVAVPWTDLLDAKYAGIFIGRSESVEFGEDGSVYQRIGVVFVTRHYQPVGTIFNVGRILWRLRSFNGASGGVLWGGDAAGIDDPGTATSKEDIYWIFYAPITTTGGNTAGRDLDGYILAAFTDKGTMLDFEATFANGAVTEGAEAEIADIQWITP